ncbi:MAG: DUF1302 family protein [Gammaproteobacteria bacterium]|uniref:DUF1302 family protein n=1 Tax=Pseudomaricurvus alcaniphilus TaxID=1166482 RepID=UPI0014085AD0|nr:DUF1302 family protein [Pseudomaricurvus alcaniphilus]MBR9912787.1 DUF1302 family protein [Gammaproteobacteria bacterium]NHN37545.1 DUF1302 family protein [Pseudomaricurvus alcaniphilus]
MSNKITRTLNTISMGVAAGLTMGVASGVNAAEMERAGFVENATYYRDGVGLSKFRNTIQGEFSKALDTSSWSNVTINGTLRGTYDRVYDLNDKEFGKDAGEDYLGQNWHPRGAATTFIPGPNTTILSAGVAFPCENDPLLCRNLGGYMDQDENDAMFPEFNDELDFIRELYIRGDKYLDNGDVVSVKLGKQQVVWGKTDLFRVLDVINPVDYSRHNIYDELEDIRIPQWMVTAEWRMGSTATFDDSNFSILWNFDEFRPNNLGTCGQPYKILDAGCFFSAYINLADLGAPYSNNVPIIHDVEDPNWSLSNTQFGFKWEGVYGDATFSVNALHYRQQLPSLHFRKHPVAALAAAGLPAPDGVFDIRFPRVTLLGGAFDYYSMATDATWRIELAYTEGEELPRDTNGHKATSMARYVIGMDKNLIIPALKARSAFLISAQLFGEHILDHVADMPNDEDNWIATLLFKGWYMNNRLSPQIIIAHDVAAKSTVVAPSISWTPDNHWTFNLALNVKSGGDETFAWSVAGTETFEPLARFTNGPIGVANQEDELQLTVRYSF